MQLQHNAELHDLEVKRLIRYIRREEENEYIAQLWADLSSESARIARYVAKVGFSLREEWKSAAHLVLVVGEYKSRLAAIHIRDNSENDTQKVDVSLARGRRREEEPVSFSLPHEFHVAKDHVLAELFGIFPLDRLVALKTRAEVIPLFEPVVVSLPPTHDEGEIKARAVEQAHAEGLGNIIRSPYADDNLPRRSFAR